MNLYEQIDLARKFGDGSKVGITESVTEHEPSKTAVALAVAKRLSESKPQEDRPIQLAGLPVSN